jgi:hypothetical protein
MAEHIEYNGNFSGSQIDTLLAKIQSSQVFTTEEKTKLSNIESEANKTIVDSTLSTTSTNPVQNKVINIALSGKQDTISDLETIRTGAELGATAVQPSDMEEALDDKVDKVAGKDLSTNDFTNEYKSQISANAAGIGAVAALGAKNNANFNFGGVVPNVNVKPGTIVCTEDNGVFSFSGATDDKNYAAYILKQLLLRAGTYRISGISGGSNTTYWMRIGTGTTDAWLFNLYDGEREFNLVSDTLITIQFVIYVNQTVSNLIIKPMIRNAAIEDSTYVPYAPTNRELYEMILALQAGT